jgi:hypothetical protein
MTSENPKDLEDLIVKTWIDPDFKARLLADPAGTLREFGVTPPTGVELVVTENTGRRKTLVLPPAPPNISILPLDELKRLARPDTTATTFGGMSTCT